MCSVERTGLGGRGVLHGSLEPALGDGKQAGRMARRERFVKPEHAAVAAVAV